MKNGYFIGAMTGTSLDGLDLALCHITPTETKVCHSHNCALPEALRESLKQLISGEQTTLHELGLCDAALGEFYAEKINEWLTTLKFDPSNIIAIGNHGQTIWHAPNAEHPFTMQIGDNHRLAARTGIPVVGDIRRMDMAYGGQGAPLVPAFHDAVFRKEGKATAVVNIGGLANVSVMLPGQAVYGFDTGPGNTLMDIWVGDYNGNKYDKDAELALQGHVNRALLAQMLQDPYFALPYPKSTGREYFHRAWLEHHLASFTAISAADVQATLCELTARTIVDALPENITELLVCGGGARNPLLMQRLGDLLPNATVADTELYQLDPDYIEAAAFAWLAYRRVNMLHGNFLEVTGAEKPAILGAIYQP
uniref:anhydro-N-acetylmuramic acid kinase n=1 Tax=Thaumasiovibrio occultus TaxID=1891184 RepID=UPI000B35A724|nr:anhydro-N-acetylmuramic acid kinase [Thaumasiovibrio occultus]